MVILLLLEWGLLRKEGRMLVFSFRGADGPSKLVWFVFPIHTMWCSPVKIPFVFLLNYMHAYPRKCTCIRRRTKEKVPCGAITWSEMRKQNAQAKKIHWLQFLVSFGAVSWKAEKCEGRKKGKKEKNRRGKQFEDNFGINIESAIQCSSYLTICFRIASQNQTNKAACKRAQQLPTLLCQQCWELLRACWQWCANECHNSQQVWDLQCIVGRIRPISLWNP